MGHYALSGDRVTVTGDDIKRASLRGMWCCHMNIHMAMNITLQQRVSAHIDKLRQLKTRDNYALRTRVGRSNRSGPAIIYQENQSLSGDWFFCVCSIRRSGQIRDKSGTRAQWRELRQSRNPTHCHTRSADAADEPSRTPACHSLAPQAVFGKIVVFPLVIILDVLHHVRHGASEVDA